MAPSTAAGFVPNTHRHPVRRYPAPARVAMMSAATAPSDEPAVSGGDASHTAWSPATDGPAADGPAADGPAFGRGPVGAAHLARGALHTGAHLAVVTGPDTGWVIGLAGRGVVLGRGMGADLRLQDPSISRHHLRVRTRGVRIQARDLNSVNGTRWRRARPHPGRPRSAPAGAGRFGAARFRATQAGGAAGAFPARWRRRTRRLGDRWQQVWPGDLLHLGGSTVQIRRHPSLHTPTAAAPERSHSDGGVLPRLILPLLMTAGMIPMLATSQAGAWRTATLVLMPLGLLVAVLWPVLSERRRRRMQAQHSPGPGSDDRSTTPRDHAHRSDPAWLLLSAQSAGPGLPASGHSNAGTISGAARNDPVAPSAPTARHVAVSQERWELGAADQHSPPHIWSPGAWQGSRTVPVPDPGAGLALLGEPAAVDGLARYLVCQHLVRHPAAAVRAPEDWTWVPPFADRNEAGSDSVADAGSGHHALHVCDARSPGPAAPRVPEHRRSHPGNAEGGTRTCGPHLPPHGGTDFHGGPLPEHLNPDPTAIHVVLARHLGQVPPWCSRIVEVRTNHDRLVSTEWAQALVRARAHIGRASRVVPGEVSITDLLGPTGPDAVLNSWRAADGALAADIGVDSQGPVRLDLVRDGPHAVVAGTTGSGKSELLLAWVMALACRYPLGDLAFLLVDYKGGATFGPISSLPQVLGLLTDLDGAATSRALASLRAELQRRERLLARVGAANLEEYRTRTADIRSADYDSLPRLMVIVDEFRAMSDEHPEHLDNLVRLAAQGRSLGIHLVLATQRPAGAINADMRANLTARVCLRVLEDADSLDTIGTPAAAHLPARPGRAILRTQQTTTFQAAWCGTTDSLRVLAGHVTEAGARLIAAEPWRADLPTPWAPPLPETIGLDDLQDLRGENEHRPTSGVNARKNPGAETSRTDDLKPPATGGPTHQAPSDDSANTALPWLRTDLPSQQRLGVGTVTLPTRVLISGPPRSGRSTAAAALAEAALRQGVPVHTLAGSQLAPADAPAVGTCCPVTDPRRAHRLLTMLATTRAAAVLIIDDVESWADALEENAGPGGGLDLIAALLRQSRRLGLSMVITATTPAHRWAGAVDQHLVLAPRDPAEAVLSGVPKELAGTGWPPGRGVLLGSQNPVLCQVAIPTTQVDARMWPEHGAPPLRLRPLPDGVALAPDRIPGLHRLWLGVGGDDAQWVSAPLPPGGTWLIAGTPGTGRSTALAMLQRQARAQNRADVHFIDDADRLGTAELARLESNLRDPEASVIATAHPERLLNAYHELGARLREADTLVALSPVSPHLAGTDIRTELDVGTPGRGVLVHGGKVLPLQVARLPG